jgi:hypothetical protein
MTDHEQVRTVIDDALRHVGSQRVITAEALASHTSQHLGRAITVAEVANILNAYEGEGKIGLAQSAGGQLTVTSVAPTFRKPGHER